MIKLLAVFAVFDDGADAESIRACHFNVGEYLALNLNADYPLKAYVCGYRSVGNDVGKVFAERNFKRLAKLFGFAEHFRGDIVFIRHNEAYLFGKLIVGSNDDVVGSVKPLDGKRYFVRRVCRDCKVVIDVETFRNNACFDVVGDNSAVFQFNVKFAYLVPCRISALVSYDCVDDYVFIVVDGRFKRYCEIVEIGKTERRRRLGNSLYRRSKGKEHIRLLNFGNDAVAVDRVEVEQGAIEFFDGIDIEFFIDFLERGSNRHQDVAFRRRYDLADFEIGVGAVGVFNV